MADPKVRVQTADTEAAAWHARLGAPSVSTRTVEEFFAWRSTPENADAYRRVERIWGGAGQAADHPEILQALDDAMGRGRGGAAGRPGFSRPVMGAAALVAVAALAFGGWTWMQARTVFSTAVGEQRLVRLADGSTVTLDTASRIRVRYDGGRRRVDLEGGQALFTVAHDRSRPFVVVAGDTRVTAVGTVFDVRRRPSGASVTLISGVVDVAVAGQGRGATRMRAGTAAEIGRAGAAVRPADVAAATSWAEGRIVFRDRPLGEAVAEINRYLDDKVELGAGAPGSARVNGVFRTGDREAFVSTVSAVFGLEAEPASDGSVRLVARRAGAASRPR